MNINPYWIPWIKASCVKHFFDALAATYLITAEGQRFTPEQEQRREDEGIWIEVRVDVTDIDKQDSNNYRVDMEVNLAILVAENPSDAYLFERVAGNVSSGFTKVISVNKYGPSGDAENDGSHIGCLHLRGTDQDTVRVTYFGESSEGEIHQGSVEAQYYIDLVSI